MRRFAALIASSALVLATAMCRIPPAARPDAACDVEAQAQLLRERAISAQQAADIARLTSQRASLEEQVDHLTVEGGQLAVEVALLCDERASLLRAPQQSKPCHCDVPGRPEP